MSIHDIIIQKKKVLKLTAYNYWHDSQGKHTLIEFGEITIWNTEQDLGRQVNFLLKN